MDLNFCGIKLSQTADFQIFCIFVDWPYFILNIRIHYTPVLNLKDGLLEGKETMTLFQDILCTPLYMRLTLSFIPFQVPVQVCMHSRHWSKFLALFRVPIRCRHTGLLSTFSRY